MIVDESALLLDHIIHGLSFPSASAMNFHHDKWSNGLPKGNAEEDWWPKYKKKPQAKAKSIRNVVCLIKAIKKVL